jgi:biotin-[acetyl-CoA-carboxylase] ligase BirA-like protein
VPSPPPVSDVLTREVVLPRLRGRLGRVYVYRERCASTQRLLGPELPEGAIAVAEEQTEGRGRLGRRWVAPRGTSILCSLLLRPFAEPARLPELTPLAAEACAEAIATQTALSPHVKHPNDVLVAGRKIAGILGEVRGDAVVLGIGVNVNIPADDLPADTRIPATSLLAETGRRIDRAALLATLLEHVERRYDGWAWQLPGRTALVVPVPEAEPLVHTWRARHTPSGGGGMPAHVTVIAPFTPAAQLSDERERTIREVAARHSRFSFELARLERFGTGTLYLAPEPAAPFVALTNAFVERFPEHPPYSGAFREPVPHLTVASGADEGPLTDATKELEGRLPLRAEAAEVLLLERDADGRWRKRRSFSLAA